jgi:hypothetical protein
MNFYNFFPFVKTELLLQVEICHQISISPKSTRKIMLNQILTMHHQKYHRLHSDWKKMMRPAFEKKLKNFGHEGAYTYQTKMGFAKGKSTKRMDLDGLAILLKWCNDLLVDITAIPDDNFHYICESGFKTLVASSDCQERVIFQVTRERPMTTKEKISFIGGAIAHLVKEKKSMTPDKAF